MKTEKFGEMNGHAIGIIMKDLVKRAVEAIRAERFSFETEIKRGKSGKMDDVVTSADRKAQEIYLKSLRECFPDFGIVAEENELRVESRLPSSDIYFTVDPLDGTKAFERLQSHGVGTMLSLVCDRKVIAAAIGDINTQEIFYYRPGSNSVWRMAMAGEISVCKKLLPRILKPLGEQYLLLRDNPREFSEGAKRFLRQKKRGGIFKDIALADGSIGLSMARLWKGEVAAKILLPRIETPWDFCPILGISQKLGFAFLEIDPKTGELTETEPVPIKTNVRREKELLIIHREYCRPKFYSF